MIPDRSVPEWRDLIRAGQAEYRENGGSGVSTPGKGPATISAALLHKLVNQLNDANVRYNTLLTRVPTTVDLNAIARWLELAGVSRLAERIRVLCDVADRHRGYERDR